MNFFPSWLGCFTFGIPSALLHHVGKQKITRGSQMKIQNVIRMQAMVVGFAGALLLASVAPAQEIVNKEWTERPGATAPFQAEPAQAAVAPAAANLTATAVAKPAAKQQAAVAQWPAVDILAVASVVALFGIAGLYKRQQSGKQTAV